MQPSEKGEDTLVLPGFSRHITGDTRPWERGRYIFDLAVTAVLAFLSPSDEGYGFIIESQALVDTLKPQFELLWEISTPLAFKKSHAQKFLDETKGMKRS